MKRVKTYFTTRIIALLIIIFPYISCAQSKRDREFKKIPTKYIPQRSTFEIPTNAFNLNNALPKGFVKDGSIDYTAYIQAALDRHKVIVFTDFPVLINDNGLIVRSNSELYFPENSKLILKPSKKGTDSNKDMYQMLKIDNVSNVKIYGIQLQGDKYTHLGNQGEWGFGIRISSSRDISIFNAFIKECWGDGIAIGRNKERRDENGYYVPSSNILIKGAIIDDNRRNGIAVTCAINLKIEDSVIANTDGTLPMSGIDIEPNNEFDQIDDIVLENITTYNNSRDGILLVLTRLPQRDFSKTCRIIVNNHLDDKSYSAMRFGSGFRSNDLPLTGEIRITNAYWKNNVGIRYRNTPNLLPKIIFQNIKIDSPEIQPLKGDKYLNGFDFNYIRNVIDKNLKSND